MALDRRTGAVEIYRRDALGSTKGQAEKQERDIIDHWTQHGTISALLSPALRVEPTPVVKTWKDAVEHWRQVKKPTLSHSSGGSYEEALATFCAAWEKLRFLAILARGFIQAWDAGMTSEGYGASRRANGHVAMRSVLRVCAHAGWFDEVEMARLPKLPARGRRVVQAVQQADVEAILNEVSEGKRYSGPYRERQRASARLAFTLAAHMGLRASELRALRWADVNLVSRMCTIRAALIDGVLETTKSGDERIIPISERVFDLLKAEKRKDPSPTDYVCLKADGTPWADKGLYQAFRRACTRLGIQGERLHGLRHFFIARLFQLGVGAPTVQALAGHADLATTQRYAHTSVAMAREAIRAFDRADQEASG